MSDAYRPPESDSAAGDDESAEVKRGRILVLVVVYLALADAVFQAAVAGRLVRAVAIAGLSVGLYHGLIWARLLFILGFAVSSGYTLWAFQFRATGWTFWSVYAALGIIAHVASVVVLMSSSAVDSFLSRRRG